MNENVGGTRPSSADSPRKPPYEYRVDLESGRSASRVARLVGKNKSILEVGCGPGSQSRAFREQLGCEVVGIEIDPAHAEKAREYCKEVYVADLETDDLAEGVRCDRLFRRLGAFAKPRNAAAHAKEYLGPDGYLVTSIPNVTHASIVYEMIHGRFEYRAEGLSDATHVRFYSCSSALSLVENSGYWVAELQKAVSAPHRTEFNTSPISLEDRELLATICSRNPDAETYQFVIKAYPLRIAPAHDASAFTMREEIRRLQGKLASYESELRRLRSTIGWYDTPLVVRILHRVKSALRAGRNPRAQ